MPLRDRDCIPPQSVFAAERRHNLSHGHGPWKTFHIESSRVATAQFGLAPRVVPPRWGWIFRVNKFHERCPWLMLFRRSAAEKQSTQISKLQGHYVATPLRGGWNLDIFAAERRHNLSHGQRPWKTFHIESSRVAT